MPLGVVPVHPFHRFALLRIEQRVQTRRELHDVVDRRLVSLKFCVEQACVIDERRVDRTRETTSGIR